MPKRNLSSNIVELHLLMERFGLKKKDLADRRIAKLLDRKLSIDQEIEAAKAAGAAEQRSKRFARAFGFKEAELTGSIQDLIGGVLNGALYLRVLKLKPKASTSEPQPTQE